MGYTTENDTRGSNFWAHPHNFPQNQQLKNLLLTKVYFHYLIYPPLHFQILKISQKNFNPQKPI